MNAYTANVQNNKIRLTINRTGCQTYRLCYSPLHDERNAPLPVLRDHRRCADDYGFVDCRLRRCEVFFQVKRLTNPVNFSPTGCQTYRLCYSPLHDEQKAKHGIYQEPAYR